MVLQDKRSEKCEKCDEKCIFSNWCKLCYMNYLKKLLVNRTSENEKIDNLVRKIQLKTKHYSDIVFEWISYNQFNSIKEIDKFNFVTVCSAIWKDGPLFYDNKGWARKSNRKVSLKYLRNTDDKLLNEVQNLLE